MEISRRHRINIEGVAGNPASVRPGADVHLCRSKGKHALTDCRSGVSPCTYDEIGVAMAELNLFDQQVS